jgi:hypothetical protein
LCPDDVAEADGERRAESIFLIELALHDIESTALGEVAPDGLDGKKRPGMMRPSESCQSD